MAYQLGLHDGESSCVGGLVKGRKKLRSCRFVEIGRVETQGLYDIGAVKHRIFAA